MPLLLLASSTMMRGNYNKARLCLKFSFIVSFLLFCFFSSSAQPTLVKDINATQVSTLQPEHTTTINGIMYFSAYSPGSGRELWRSNGTKEGTFQLKDIIVGIGSSNPEQFTEVNGTIYFVANRIARYDADYTLIIHQFDLWKTDGTTQGTVKIRTFELPTNINPSDVKLYLMGVNGYLFFTVPSYGVTYLWKTNGTSSGTIKVANVVLDTEYNFNIAGAGKYVYYTSSVREENNIPKTILWRTDGTPAGTIRLLEQLETYDGIISLTAVNNIAYFVVKHTNLRQLWKTDGTLPGTGKIKDIDPKSYNGILNHNLTNVNGNLFFTTQALNEPVKLWKSDGTATGTVIIKEQVPGWFGIWLVIGNTLYFTSGNELWKSDGTPQGTLLLKTFNNRFYGLTAVNNLLYILTNSSTSSTSIPTLWKSDGTTHGTIQVNAKLPAVQVNSYPYPVALQGTLYFTLGDQFWKSNGTEATTQPVILDNIPQTGSSSPGSLYNANGTLYFTASNDSTGQKFWKSNGTEAGTVPVSVIGGTSLTKGVSVLTHINTTVLYKIDIYESYQIQSSQLWRTDGSAAGTLQLKTFAANEIITNAIAFNGLFYFISGKTLWKTDGTPAGTTPVKVFTSGNIVNLTLYNNTLLFGNGSSLWKTDGTPAGTLIIKELSAVFNSSVLLTKFTPFNGYMYFLAPSGIWKTDGTASGTILTDIMQEMAPSIGEMAATSSGLYLASVSGIWKSNGTSESTLLLKSFSYYHNRISTLTPINGTLYFVFEGWDPGDFRVTELWQTDGTLAGTIQKDLGLTGFLMPVNNSVYYLKGYNNLWRSNLTENNTKQISEIAINSYAFTKVGNTLYFGANNGLTGYELWKYDIDSCKEVINKNPIVQGSTICVGKNGQITIKATETGITYQAYMNGSVIGNPAPGGGNITLTIPAASLSLGNNKFTIKASGCTLTQLSTDAISIEATITVLNCPSISCSNVAQSSLVVNPSSGGILSGTTLYLKTIPGASSYTLQVSTSSDFTTGVITKTTASRLSTGTYYAAFPELSLNQKYYVRVYTNLGLCWGPVTSFTTASATASAYVTNPSDGGTTTGTSLYLNTVPGATSYTLQVSTSSDFTTGLITRTTASRLSTGTYYASFPEFLPNQKYYVRVKTNLSDIWGRTTSFTTASAAGSAFVSNPSDGSTTTGTSLYLNTVPGATSYTLQVSTSSDFTTSLITRTTASRLSTGTYYAVFPELSLNQKYYVRVKTNLSQVWGRTTSFTRVNATARLAASEQSAAESLESKVSIYPNPFETTLTLSTTRTGTIYITVVDNLSRIVYQRTAQASGIEITLDLAHLKTGVYFLKTVSEAGKTDIQKIVKR